METLPPDNEVIQNRPILMNGLDLYFTAFSDLQSECAIGMEKGKIPWYSIVRWCNFYGIVCPDTIDRFVSYIRAMESEQSRFVDKKKDKGNKA